MAESSQVTRRKVCVGRICGSRPQEALTPPSNTPQGAPQSLVRVRNLCLRLGDAALHRMLQPSADRAFTQSHTPPLRLHTIRTNGNRRGGGCRGNRRESLTKSGESQSLRKTSKEWGEKKPQSKEGNCNEGRGWEGEGLVGISGQKNGRCTYPHCAVAAIAKQGRDTSWKRTRKRQQKCNKQRRIHWRKAGANGHCPLSEIKRRGRIGKLMGGDKNGIRIM